MMREGFAAHIPDPAAVSQQGQLDLLAVPAGPLHGRAGGGAGRDAAARDRRPEAAGVDGAVRGVMHRRQGPRPRPPARSELRARRRDPRPRHGALRKAPRATCRWLPLGALRPAPPKPADLLARGQRGVAGRQAARPRRAHAGLAAAAHRPSTGESRRLVHLPDGRGHGRDRLRGRPRLPRRVAVAARPAAAVQDAPADPAAAGRRRADRAGAPRRSPRAACSSVPDRLTRAGRA